MPNGYKRKRKDVEIIVESRNKFLRFEVMWQPFPSNCLRMWDVVALKIDIKAHWVMVRIALHKDK